jgi:hypothetical protein
MTAIFLMRSFRHDDCLKALTTKDTKLHEGTAL